MGIQARVRPTLAILLLAAGAFCLRSAAQPAAKAGTNCGGCPTANRPVDWSMKHRPPLRSSAPVWMT